MSEITYEFIREYLQAIQEDEDEFIDHIRQEALTNGVPIIKNEVKQLLEVLLTIQRPKHILEIGTAVGYSSIIMSKYLDEGGTITTIERSKDMIDVANKYIKMAGKETIINILEGDAQSILPNLNQRFDFIFMDAAKGQYISFLPYCLKLLRVEGILVSDNVLQDGYVAKSRWSIPRRQRTIHGRMREYLWELNHNKALRTVILPIADGATISCKLKEGE
ncbi:MAG: O-methyltransferase [Firmicutes bacterium HGW-Firmicutes-7]|nr:MAG: O-methyltransferase [Firmicutes bacterium HGW-Firmicutes-7]